MYHYKECGLDYIYLKDGYIIINDPEYGECVSFNNLEEMHQEIMKNIIEKVPQLRGQEVRFIRSELKQTQTQMADMLGVTLRTIQRWEKSLRNTPIPKTVDKLLRLLITSSSWYLPLREKEK